MSIAVSILLAFVIGVVGGYALRWYLEKRKIFV